MNQLACPMLGEVCAVEIQASGIPDYSSELNSLDGISVAIGDIAKNLADLAGEIGGAGKDIAVAIESHEGKD